MPGTAPPAWDHESCTRPRVSRALLCGYAFVLAACSVYTDDMVGDATSNVDDGESSSSGKGNAVAGKSQTGSGGKTSGSLGGTGSTSTAGTAVVDGGMAGTASEPGAGTSGSTSAEAGSTGVGGSAGTGGGGAPVTLPADLLDGFEDDDLTLEQSAGRGGVWYLFDDGTVGKAGPTPLVCAALADAPAGLGDYGMHITSSGFTGWGSGLGVDFRAGKKAYDGSKHSGLRFWARVGEGKNTRHRLQIVDGTSDALGGKCDPAVDALAGTKCDDHFGINQIFTSSWAQYSVLFADLTQVGFGNSAPAIDKTTLYGLQVTAKAKLDVELWLDQIEFF